jgi:hypothetical protein
MRRSRAVPIATLSAIALAFGACGSDEEETAYCVDEENRVVDNSECDERYHGGTHGGFFWLFLAGNRFGGRTPTPGQRLPTDGAERVRANDRSTLQSRGGFGSQARGGGIGRTVSAGG